MRRSEGGCSQVMDNFYFLIDDRFVLLATKKIRKTKRSCLKMIVLKKIVFEEDRFIKLKTKKSSFNF